VILPTKCERCHRNLKRIFTVNGKSYGSTCIKIVAPGITVDYVGGRPLRRHVEYVNPGQLLILEV
jgi:hypothetical protein